MTAFIIGRNGNVNKFGWRIGITESHNRDVDIGSFFDGLRIGSWVSDDDKTRLFERASNVICEVSWSETTRDGRSSCMGGELQDRTLTIRTSRNDSDIGGVLDRDDYTGREDNFLPKL